MKKAEPIRLTDIPGNDETPAMPAFTIVPMVGKESLDSINADLTLITVVQGMRVPLSLHAENSRVGDTIKRTIKDQRFGGRLGQSLLFDVPLTEGQTQRKILLLGIGRSEEYDSQVACKVFGDLFDKALGAGVASLVVPVVRNRATGGSVSIKSMVIKLRKQLAARIAKHDGPIALKEVQFYCTPQARRHVQDGLDCLLTSKPARDCECED